ncbi:pectin acetylesterase-family hydrolase [Anaeromyxobacter sp. SG66]|uniref:pectin acetylesterase-family hydrolase n=1 Tax=Anaeromyxobacter sp. SG66 TaxID=2925410 RepID=UPI001F58113C|nr:pectin acetylesterase-family hydrolase [Anaeromyxobacter sp. SG66]
MQRMRIPDAVRRLLAVALLTAAACGGGNDPAPGGDATPPPLGAPISRTEGAAIAGAAGWTWIPFEDAFCTDAALQPSGEYQFGTSTTGLALSWGSPASTDLVVFLQGGGACWDFFTCGGAPELVPKTASSGPFGPDEFARDIYAKYPRSWVRRENLPAALRDATIVFVPYCTGDVHSGDAVATYASPIQGRPSVTWHHVGHANVLAFLKRLGATFPSPAKLVVSGSSAGGFGSLSSYSAARRYWPHAKGYLVDDSGPPLAGAAIPASTRDTWYARWGMGASLDGFCPGCRTDLSQGLRELAERYPGDRIALLSHLQDLTIRGFFGTFTLLPSPAFTPMPADRFEAELRLLGTSVMDPATSNAKYFFTTGDAHPTLEDPTVVTTPAPGLEAWLELMLADSAAWESETD